MAKEAFNRKTSIFCGPLEKELQKRLMKRFVWSVELYGAETWTMAEWAKTTGSIWDVDMENDGACKMDRQNKNVIVLERIEGTIMLELIKKRKINWLGHCLRRNSLMMDALGQGSSTFWVRGPIYIFRIILRAAVIADYKIIMDILNIIFRACAARQVT